MRTIKQIIMQQHVHVHKLLTWNNYIITPRKSEVSYENTTNDEKSVN
jgi:hypothetical protein